MRSRLRGTPSRGGSCVPGIAPGHGASSSTPEPGPQDALTTGRCRGGSGSRMVMPYSLAILPPSRTSTRTARTLANLSGDAESTFRYRPLGCGLRLVVSGDDPLADRTSQRRRLEAESQLFEHSHGVETEAAGGVVGAFEVRVLFALWLSPHEAAEPGAVGRDPVVVHHMIVPRAAIGEGIARLVGVAGSSGSERTWATWPGSLIATGSRPGPAPHRLMPLRASRTGATCPGPGTVGSTT